MKKHLFFLSALLSVITCSAQTIFFDNFSTDSLPGWTVTNVNSNSNVLWKWNNGTSGGQATGQFNYDGASTGCIIADSDGDGDQSGATNEYTFITSDAINCTGFSTVVLSYNEYYAKYQSDTPVVFISKDSTNWVPVYSPSAGFQQDQETANPNFVEINVSSVAANSSTVYIRFSWKGKYDYWWFIDDVRLFVPSKKDASVVNFSNTLSNGCQLSNAEVFKMSIRNKGLDSISTLSVFYSVNGGTPVNETVTITPPLAFDSVFEYTFTTPANLNAPNNYNISAWVNFSGDTLAGNDSTASFAISAAPSAVPYTMGFEVPPIGAELGGYTWLSEDANNDGFTWYLSTSAPFAGDVNFRYYYNFDNTGIGGNDWLFSPCMNLSANTAYKISFYQQVGISQGTVFDEKLELFAGNDNTSSAMTDSILDFGTLSNSDYEERLAAYKPGTSGSKYLGFKCYSNPDAFYLDIDDVNITVLDPPTAQFTTSLIGNAVNVTDASEELITDWNWNWGDGTSSTGQTPAPHTYASAGSYEICLVVNNLAGSDTTCKMVVVSGLDNMDNNSSVHLFPNPTNDAINIQLHGANHSLHNIEIMDMNGKTIYENKNIDLSATRIDMKPFAGGIYTVKVTNDRVTYVDKFVFNK